jgi:hypothetical protein
LSGTAIRVVEGLGDSPPAPAARAEAEDEAPSERPARDEPRARESKPREPRERGGRGGRGRSSSRARPEPKADAAPEPEAQAEARPEREPERRPEPKREPEARARPRAEPKRQRREEPADEGDDGWNGPVPSFLGKPFGG